MIRARENADRERKKREAPGLPTLVEVQITSWSSGDSAGRQPSAKAGYILALDVVAEALRAACGDDVEVVPATITSKATGESWSSYREIRPIAELRGPDDLSAARLSARTAWRFQGGHFFVSRSVKEKLVRLAPFDLELSVGFSQFGGMRGY